jgi:microcystin degradation protein MlrC
MTKRVLISQIMHETNTFSRLATDLDAYRRRYLLRGDEIAPFFRGTRTEMGALLDAGERFGWQLVPAIAANATPSGTVTAECWDELSGAVIKAARERGPFDGVVLALHGAMVAATADDAEGDLLERLRRVIGPDVPVAITLDLHANVTDKMAAHANAIIAYRTYPHIDQY